MTQSKFTRKLVGLLRCTKLRTRLIAAFLLISLLPCLGLTLFSLRVYSNSIVTKLSQSAQQTTQLLNHNLTLILNNYSRYISTCSVSNEIQNYLSNRSDVDAISEYISGYSLSTSSVLTTVYLRDTLVVDAQHNVVYSRGHVGYTKETIESILKAADQTSPKDYLGYYCAPYGADCITLCRKFYKETSLLSPAGYIVLFLSPTIFDKQTFPVSFLGDNASMFLMNRSGEVISSQNESVTDSPQLMASYLTEIKREQASADGDSFRIEDAQNLIIYTYNETYDLYMVSLIPKDNIYQEIDRVSGIVVVFSMVLLLLCLLLSLSVYQSVSAPIDIIVTACSRTNSDTPYADIGDTSPDELGYLSRTIDTMARNNESMLRDLHRKDRQKRELELEMLQYQINPHFLFNTLNTLKWIATINGVETLSTGISALAGILRNTLEKTDELIPLQNELDVLKDYCAIQSLRYAGQFNITYQVDPEALGCLLPRFLLQPLVENAILHGIRNNDTILNISVVCEHTDSLLRICIQDDGAGFLLDSVLDKEKNRFTGIGLANVDERLQLYYGEAVRLSIQSQPNGGTTCRITIPTTPDTPAKEK